MRYVNYIITDFYLCLTVKQNLMKKLLLILGLICIYANTSAQADATKYKYCKAIVFQSLDANRNTLAVDSGQLFKGTNEMKYKSRVFVSEMEAINFLSQKGWSLINTCVTASINITYIFRKPIK